MDNLAGKQLGPYQIVAPLGEGGMAAVFRAYHPSMDRYVALKVLPRHFSNNAEFVQRFSQEARLIAKLEHPHILPVHDFGESDGYTYLAMRLVKGGSLADLLKKRRKLDLELINRIVLQVGSALNYAHEKGIVHRDFKPGNILIDKFQNCLLTDFGIAKLVEATTHLTHTGGILGTPAYISPEQGAGEPIDNRSDIYSLGVVLYQMVVGDLPYKADTPMAVIFKHINAPLPIPRHKIPELPESVERVILKSLSKNPDDRYMTAGEMVRALQKAIDHPTVVQTLKSTSQREEDGTKAATKPVHVKPTKPRFLKWAVRILAIFLLGIGIGVYIDTILTNQRVTEFKSEAQTVAESISPSIASSILGYDPKRSDSPPRDLHDMMKAIGRGQKLFTYAILYMPDQSENHVLWRYQAKMWYDEYKDDNRKISPAGGFRKIFISTPLERAMQKAFNGDITALSSFNSNSKSSWQSVITGKIGKPIAILRLTIWGIGGDERMIK